jgi:hypothetical protein
MVMQFLKDNKQKNINNKINKPIYIEKAYQILVKNNLIIPPNLNDLAEGERLIKEVEDAEAEEEQYNVEDDEE